ncbi:alanine racemase [Kocuria palustris]|uniref:alanine racemase n=1 Tax=Kocuria palustris TaxID=71999 RepID=UPI0011A81CE2|nr:alanine racemase [Kocuria palustris]
MTEAHVDFPAQHLPDLPLATPAVVVDRRILEANIVRVAASAQARGLSLRPHAKTHKMPEIARRQIAAGAVGLTVATIGEAEVFAGSGVEDLFIAYPLWVDMRSAVRLRILAEKVRLRIGTDSVEAVEQIARELDGAPISVSLEVDSGHHRSGAMPDEALAIAARARDLGVRLDGVFTFPGHSYAPGQETPVAEQESEILAGAARRLREAGHEIVHLSGGSTPTAEVDGPTAAQEIRPGVYVFGDAQQLELGRIGIEGVSLSVVSTVVSRHDHDGPDGEPLRRIILDAGSKVLGSDRPAWASGFGRLPNHPRARITALSEHHATVVLPAEEPLPAMGEQVRVIPNHVCQTVNLVDSVTVIDAAAVLETWHVAARGLNR